MAADPPVQPVPAFSLRVHHAGDWQPEQVATAWAPSSLSVPAEVQRTVDDAWERAMIEPNRTLFDGPMCRLESWDFAPGRVSLGMSRTSYKHFWGTNLTHPEYADRFGAGVMANPVGVSPALESADGFLLLGRRNAEVAYYPTRVHPFAGCLEPGDGTGAGPDLFVAVARELTEELRFTPADIELVRLTGLVEDVRLRQPELIFRVKSRLTRDRIESQLDAAEHRGSVAVRATPEDVGRAMADPALTPVAVASLLLWGKVAFGDAWFAAHSPR
jgi:8-oxo-dGTP pyrophosphatase MutT (NUDIX family)